MIDIQIYIVPFILIALAVYTALGITLKTNALYLPFLTVNAIS